MKITGQIHQEFIIQIVGGDTIRALTNYGNVYERKAMYGPRKGRHSHGKKLGHVWIKIEGVDFGE